MAKNKWFWLFISIAILLSNIMCATVGYNWAVMECGIKHQGYSAPAYIALISGIPFLIAIIMCIVIIMVIKNKKSNINGTTTSIKRP